MIELAISGDEAAAARFDSMAARIHRRLLDAITANAAALQAHVVQDALSGKVLKARSGRLKDSIAVTVADTGDGIAAGIGSDAPYAAIQEFGGQTAPHVIAARNAAVLAFRLGGRTVFARRVQHPGSRIPARPFLRAAMAEQADRIRDSLRAAVGAAIAP